MAIVEDPSAPATVVTSTATTLTTASFTPPVPALIIAMVSANGGGLGGTTVTITDSGAHTWTGLALSNAAPGGNSAGAAQISCTYLTAPGSLTVTATAGGATANGMRMAVRVLVGAAQTQPGGTATQGGSNNVNAVSITTTVPGARVYGALIDWGATTTFTANANTTIINQSSDATNVATYAPVKSAGLGIATPGPITIGVTNAAFSGNLALAEILPAAVPAPESISQYGPFF